ncbi:MAG: LLM class F420-dependent oxidoreductase [Deltaproteobacteria bacterium]|nr:LLM class F420-dependent oxidoreductase [Deltaproteobacteria bacterium]
MGVGLVRGRSPARAETIVWLSYAAAVTTRINLGTGIVILPQRHPFYVAKEAATLSVLSGGRFIMGVGIGWLEEEFDALDVPFEHRAAITDESIGALRDLWSEGACEHEGGHYAWPAVESNPKPVGGRVPIVIGGHTKGAARRAARLGDGFFPASPGTLDECIAEISAECARIGRDPSEIEITIGGVPTHDEVKRLQDMGVACFTLGPPGFAPDVVRAGLEKLGDELISKF